MCCCTFHATATTEIYTLSLHDALPISRRVVELLDPERDARLAAVVAGLANRLDQLGDVGVRVVVVDRGLVGREVHRSEEHTSELQSRLHLVCRLLLEKKKKKKKYYFLQ